MPESNTLLPLSPSPPLRLVIFAALVGLTLLSTAHSQETPLLRPPSGPAEILERFDIGPSQLESFFNGQPLSPSEEDVLAKILYRLPRLGLENLLRWRQQGVTWEQVASNPAEHRTHVFHLSGRVKQIEKRLLLPEQVELFEFRHYYRVTLALDNSPYQAVIAARHIPIAWESAASLDEPAQADAIFLKVGESTAEMPQLMFAADRIGWYPDRPDPQNHIGPSQLALAKLGMDIGLWDDVRQSKDHSLAAADREPFYQLLAALGSNSSSPPPLAPQPLNLVSLLEKSADHLGEIYPVEGLARRIMKVPVSDADIRARFSLDHYYEIDLFVPLGNASLRFGTDSTGEKNPVYHNKFPATLIVRDLPPDLAESENVHELVRADAVFFKVWSYRSSYTSRYGQLQPAPLFIASTVRLVPTAATTNWVTSGLVLVAFALALGVTAIIVLAYGRTDRAAAKAIAKDKAAVKPDFSGLG